MEAGGKLFLKKICIKHPCSWVEWEDEPLYKIYKHCLFVRKERFTRQECERLSHKRKTNVFFLNILSMW